MLSFDHLSPVGLFCECSRMSLLRYGDLVYSKYRAPSAQQYFTSKFGRNDIQWSQIYLILRSTSTDMKTRIFQFKILNNILYLNARLYKMGIVSSSKCSPCSERKETTNHLFFECRVSANLWSAIQNHVQNCPYLHRSERRECPSWLYF